MGRCYEFGAEIHAGCEQAMVVTAEGGACVCRTCGTRCTGRFSGCAVVLSVPGRTPRSAPAWAVAEPAEQAPPSEALEAALARRRRLAAGSPPRAGAGGSADPPAAAAGPAAVRPSPLSVAGRVRANGHGVASPGASTLGELAEVQRALLHGVQRLTDEHARVADALARLGADSAGRHDDLAAAVARLGERHDQLAGEMARFRGQMDKVGVAIDRLAATLVRVEQHLDSHEPPSLRRRLGL